MRNIGATHIKTTLRCQQANREVDRENRLLMKRMRIAQAEVKDWQDEILTSLRIVRTYIHVQDVVQPSCCLVGKFVHNSTVDFTSN